MTASRASVPKPRVKRKRMWGVMNHRDQLVEVQPSKGQAELAQYEYIDATSLRPVLVTYTTPGKREIKG